MIIGGLIALFFGGQWVVSGAVSFAKLLGVSDFLISATIIAIGTSLPELITSIVAIRKKEADIAIGNIIGSNIFNVFLILGISGLISPILISSKMYFDIVFLVFITILLFLFVLPRDKNVFRKEHSLKRWHGIVFVCLYVFYVIFIIVRG
ncbi:MAG: hypothetical protein WC755_05435 [Candidatus Woesearchaeota archaeon]|jgi:cation:H+ antiporter